MVAGAVSVIPVPAASAGSSPPLSDYAGRYAPERFAPGVSIEIGRREGRLTIAPLFWRPPRLLVPIGRDSFQMDDRRERQVIFSRDGTGRVVAVRVAGVGFPESLRWVASGDTLPGERLERGEPRLAFDALLAAGADAGQLVTLARRMRNVPTLVPPAVAFLATLAAAFPGDAAVRIEWGNALVAAGRREEARARYRDALAIDAAAREARDALARLGDGAAADSGWRVPFPLAALFAPPRAAEIDTVWRRWGRRDLSPSGVETVLARTIDLGRAKATLRIVAHRVHGLRHLGAIIVPLGVRPGSCPLVLEAKGVSWDFAPLRIPEGLNVPGILGDEQARFVHVVPGFRGEQIVVGADTLRCEGGPSDAWDGATDDLLALLGVALATTPEADPSRVAVFGRSRGGTVALLAAERDPRIRLAIAWAAPTDWFEGMGLAGWTECELVADGLHHRAAANQPGGQFVNYFLRGALDGRDDLAETRLHMIASSPLFFADRAPFAQVHYGVDDGIVPECNGRSLEARVRAANSRGDCIRAFFHPGSGHDQDPFVAPRETRRALAALLGGRLPDCR